jgi:hypothetical protein
VIVLLLLADTFVVKRVTQRLSQLRDDIALMENRVEQNESILAQKDVVQEEIDKAFLYNVQRSGEGEQEDRTIRTEVESLARESGVRIVQSKPQGVRRAEYEEEHLVLIEIEGAADRLILFLHGIQESLQLLRVKRMELKPSEQSPATDIKGVLLISKTVTV